jgi:hypothetical protein
MNATEATAITHDAERLTWAEICKRFPDEWVVLVDADRTNDRDFEFGTALVVGPRRDRKEASIDVKAAFLNYRSVGCFWTGKIRGPLPRIFLS